MSRCEDASRPSKRVLNIAPYPGSVGMGRKLHRVECAGCNGKGTYGDTTGTIVSNICGNCSLTRLALT